jgi:hypothetical protein
VRRALILVTLCLVGAAALPSIASAGQYHVLSCRDASGAPLSTAAWVPFGNVANPLAHTDTCAAGEWLGIQMIDPADYNGGSTIGYAFTPPAGTTIAAYDIQMAGKTSSPPGNTHFELGLLLDGSPTVDAGDGCRDDLDPCLFGDWQDAWDAPINRFARSSLSAGALAFAASCTAPSACVVGTDNLPYPAFGHLFRSDVTIDDPVAPTVSALGGTIADPGAATGLRTVTADAADVGGGVQRVELLVDGALADQIAGAGRCAVPYTAAAPCPDATTGRFSLDTTTLANGSHTIVVRAVDAAGNATPSAPLTVDVANAAPGGGSVVVVPGPTQTVTVPASPSAAPVTPSSPPAAPVAVTLRTPAKRVPLARARQLRGTASRGGVRLAFERRAFGADEDDWQPAGTTTTADDGSFRFPAVHQSGQVRVRPAPASVGGRALVVSVVGPLQASLHSSASRLRNGNWVTLRGRVRGDGGAWTGREALIQAIVRGHWRTIDTTAVSDRGRIVWRYRFAHTRSTADYRFRLRLPAVRARPWKTVTTRPVSVLVRGG